MTGPGESAGPVSVRIPVCMLRDCPMDIADTLGGCTETENDWEDEEDAEDMAESVSRAFHDLLHIAEDSVSVFSLYPRGLTASFAHLFYIILCCSYLFICITTVKKVRVFYVKK